MLRLNTGKRGSPFLSAFTLIELLIVLVVIAILVGVTIPISKYVAYRARLANQQVYVEKIKSALEDYRATYGEYPITPTNDGAARHYVNIDYNTKDCSNYFNPSASSFTNVYLATNTVETITTEGATRCIDYALTYPLMLRQRAEGARPFMEFKDVTVAFLVYNAPGAEDIVNVRRRRRLSDGVVDETTRQGVRGKPVNRPKAVDPVSQKQWKYTSLDGITYTLTNHTASGY